ncbi:MAG: hypothetical protein CSA84_07290 [Actinomycetales bacterium]|nr:MAG: hypothetical protein CSA84_07290 [Actinomycetales bacterium]
MARIHTIGAGVVGAPTDKGFLQHGYDVRFFDADPDRVQGLAAQGLSVDLPHQIALSDAEAVFMSVTALTSASGIDRSHVHVASDAIVARDAVSWDVPEVATHRDWARRDVPQWGGRGVRNA